MIAEIRKEFWVSLQGKSHPTWPGVLVALHESGLLGIEVNVLQYPTSENGFTAVCQALVTMKGEDGRELVFSEVGDANAANVGARIAPHILRMAACVPLNTEILTRAGWKRYDSLVVGEDVLAYDCDTDTSRWTPLEAVSVFEEDHPTVRISSRSVSFVCTPNHSWAVAEQRMRTRLIETDRLRNGQSIVQAAVAQSGDSPLSPREAAILGWLATDGNTRESMVTDRWGTFGPYLRATVYQSKEQYLPVLRELLGTDATECVSPPNRRDFSFMGGKVSDCRESHRWHVRAPFLRQVYRNAGIERLEELPGLVLRLSRSARAAMLEAMMQAEGHHKGGNRWEFYQRKPWVMEAFVLLSTLEGRALGASESKGVRWDRRTLRSRRHLTAANLFIEPEAAQPVWCPTTMFGTWVMRQDGMVTITGNTRAKGRAGRDALALGIALAEEMGPDAEDAPRTQQEARPAVPRARHDPQDHASRMPYGGPDPVKEAYRKDSEAKTHAGQPDPEFQAASQADRARHQAPPTYCSARGCGALLSQKEIDGSRRRWSDQGEVCLVHATERRIAEKEAAEAPIPDEAAA